MGGLAWARQRIVADGSAGGAAHWPLAGRVLLLGLAVLGIALRLSCAGRPYWMDEAWVLNSVQSASLAEMFNYREWLQSTPPGLLILLRALALTWPQHIDGFRWLFVLCGCISLVLFMRVASRLLAGCFACLAVAVFAFSPAVVWNVTELKQYSLDVLAMCAALVCGLAYIERPTRAMLTRWCVLNLGFLSFSYSAMFSLPAMVIAALLLDAEAKWRARLRAVLPYAVGSAVAVSVLLVGFVRDRAGMPSLVQFWSAGFYSSSGDSPLFYARRSLSLLFNFFDVKTLSTGALLAVLALCAVGVIALGWAERDARRRWATSALLTAPIIATFAANLLGRYPLGEYRTVAFLAPPLVVLLALGVQAGARLLAGCCAGPWQRAGFEGLGVCATLAMTVYLASTLGFPLWAAPRDGGTRLWRGLTEIQPALSYLRAVDDLRRPLFVHAFYQQIFAYHTRNTPLRATVSFASSGYPCCIPGKPWNGYEPSRQEVAGEVATLAARNGQRPFHVLLYARPSWPSRDSVVFYEKAFAARGCAVPWRYDTYRVSLLRVECGVSK